MATVEQVTAALNAALVKEKKTAGEIASLQASLAGVTSERDNLDAANKDLAGQVVTLEAGAADLTAKLAAAEASVADLQQKLSGMSGSVDDGVAGLAEEVNAQAEANDGAITDLPPVSDGSAVPVPPPVSDGSSVVSDGSGVAATATDPVIKAEVEDNTQAGVDRRLGAVAPAGIVFPDVYERPQAATKDMGWQGGKPAMPNYSVGLEVTGPVPAAGAALTKFDYGSTCDNLGVAPDDDLVITGVKTGGDYSAATINGGLGLYRIRSEEHSGGLVENAPVVPYNDTFIDADSLGHVRYGMKDKIGRIVAQTRARINRRDGGLTLYSRERGGAAYVGSVGTNTARPAWSGTSLDPAFIPLCIVVSNQNEFYFVGGHNEKTGRGQVAVYWQWSGNDLLTKESGKGFPFDFSVAHPGLINSGVIAGTKPFGYFDLPIAWPTSIDISNFAGSGTRIAGPDGNAAYLNVWPLDTDAQRTAFLAKNGTWIPSFGKVCVTSRYENKAVMLDFTALFAGVRDQYFGSQANYDQTAYAVAGGGTGWNAYNLTDPLKFPWGVEAKPAWAPVVAKVVDLPAKPNAVLMSISTDPDIDIACADGFVRTYKFDGTQTDTIRVGDNPVFMAPDKYLGERNGGPVVTCRGSRSIVLLSKFGAGATVVETIQDPVIQDPVAAVIGDMHGSQERYYVILDFNGKQVVTMRSTPYKFATQGGSSIAVGPAGATPPPAFERLGRMALAGKPHSIIDSNIN